MNKIKIIENYEILYGEKYIKIKNNYIKYDLYDKNIKIQAKDIFILEEQLYYHIFLMPKLKDTDSYGIEYIAFHKKFYEILEQSMEYDIKEYYVAKIRFIDTINEKLCEYLQDEILVQHIIKNNFSNYIQNYCIL